MEKLIYYPSFEPPNKAWLRFALLYFEEFRPIIPQSKTDQLSDDYQRLIGETDLIRPISPEYLQTQRASIKAIEEIENLFEKWPRSRVSFGHPNLKNQWQKRDKFNFLIYSEKFSIDFFDFCRAHEIGTKCDDGLLLPESLAFIYMTNLAKEIAYENEFAIVTDNNRFDNYTNLSMTLSPLTIKKNVFAKNIINFLVPKNLENIEINKLIKFRKKNRKMIKAFNVEIDNVQNAIGNGLTSADFINSFQKIHSEFSKEILLQGIGIASIPFAAYVLLQNPQAITSEYVNEILGGLGIVIGGTYSLHKLWIDNENRRYCKKYLTNLRSLS